MSSLVRCLGLALLALGPVCVDAAHSSETAVWTPRKVSFAYMGVTTHYSCEGLLENVRSVLLQLGARAEDLHVRPSGCLRGTGPEQFPGVDATFFVLAPPAVPNAAGRPVEVSWQPVDIMLGATSLERSGNCELLEQIRKSILPLFTTRNLEFTQNCFPHQLTLGGTRLHVEVLKPVQKQPAAR
jgi:hypothetical protein